MQIPKEDPPSTMGTVSRREVIVGAAVSTVLSLATPAPAAEATTAPAESSAVRRVVTALDDNGKSIVLFDNQVVLPIATGQPVVRNFWTLDSLPAVASMKKDLGQAPVTAAFGPGPQQVLFRTVDFAPAPPPDIMKTLDPSMFMKLAGDEAPRKGLPPASPFTHRTKTIDFAVVLSGEIDMMLDDSSVHLKPGDVVVQQETNHAWINHGNQPCRIAFVQIAATEP